MVSKRISVGRRGSATTRVINTVPTRNNAIPNQETVSNERRDLGAAANARNFEMRGIAVPEEAGGVQVGGNANGEPQTIPEVVAELIELNPEERKRAYAPSDVSLENSPNPAFCIGPRAKALLMAMCARIAYLTPGTAANVLKTQMGMTDLHWATPAGLDFPICFMSWGQTLVVGIPGWRTVQEVRENYGAAVKSGLTSLVNIDKASIIPPASVMWSFFDTPAATILSHINVAVQGGSFAYGSDPEIYVVGHSRGGAIAACLAARVENSPTSSVYNNYKAAYSFGAPPVAYAGKWANEQISWCHDYFIRRDPVPYLLRSRDYFAGNIYGQMPESFGLSDVGRQFLIKEWRLLSPQAEAQFPNGGRWESIEQIVLAILANHMIKTYLEGLRADFGDSDAGMLLSQSFKDSYELCVNTL